jgi:anti-sigma regulatory factor (Ser/Thr protein kinase)
MGMQWPAGVSRLKTGPAGRFLERSLSMQKKLNRSYDSLEEMYEITESFFLNEDVEPSIRFPVHFVMEELFTNMVKYHPENSNEILLAVNTTDGAVTVSMTDYDVDAFDVTVDRNINTDAPLAERTPGGLGIHLIHKMVDTLEYDYADRRSTITFTKGRDT